MWPMLLDYSRDECKRMLRRLELDAYSSIVSVFRAQGELSRDKKKLLQDLQHMLSISVERHRAEVRRAVNDERLSTVADSSTGSTSAMSEWLIEGRRLVPLLPRLVPQTTFTQTANQMAKEAGEKNLQLLNPALTGNKELANQTSTSTSTTAMATVATKPSRPTSPTSNVVVLPSGTSIHIKGLNPDEEDEPLGRRQRRSLSIDSLGAATASTQTQTARVIYTTASSTQGSASPVKITISKSPQGRTIMSQPGGQPPKVILVTSSSQSSASTMFQRSMSVPVIRASTSTSTSQSGATRTSIIIPGSPGMAHSSSMPGVVTVTTTSITTSTSGTVTVPTSVVGGSQPFSPSVNIGKPRPKVVPRQRFPHPQTKPGVVIPMGPGGPQPVAPAPQNLHNIQVKTVPKAPIHIKQEGGMKIITQSVTGASKILPKPAQLAGSPGTPVVVVNAGPSSSAGGNTTVTMVPKTVGSYSTATGSKVLNITTPGGRVIATTTKASNVVTVNPKTLHLTAVKSAAGGTTVSKPNVIVVQKTQARRPQLPAPGMTKGGTTVITSPAAFEKELANFIQKESGRQVSVSISPSGTVTSAAAVGGRAPEHRVIITTSGNSDPNRQGTLQKLVPTDAENRSTLLAELIQAAGIEPEGAAEGSAVSSNEWFEYDVADDTGQVLTSESLPVSTVQSIMGLQNSGAKIVHRSSSSDDQQAIPQEQYYSLEQAVSLLNPETPTTESTTILTSQPTQQRIITSSGERIITTGTDAGKTVVEIPRRLPPSLVAPQTVVQTVRTEVDGSSRPGELTGLQQSGELDPQTGLFYNTGVPGQQIMVNTRDGSILTSQISVTPQPHAATETRRISPLPVLNPPVTQVLSRPVTQTVVSVPVVSQPLGHPTGQPMDLLSSSLAQAQINLESYDFGEEGLETYGSLETAAGGMVVEGGSDGLSDDQQQLGAGETINFDAHTALLEESEAGATEMLTTGPPGTLNNSSTVPVPGILQVPLQQQQQLQPPPPQQQQQQSGVSSVSVPRISSRSAAFIPLEDVKEARSSGINIVTHDQRESPVTTTSQSVTATLTNNAAIVNSSNTVLLSSTSTTTATSTLHNSKVFTAPVATAATSVPTVSISLSSSSSSFIQPPASVTLSSLPQGGGVSTLHSSAAPICSVSTLSQNSVTQSSSATFVSVTNTSLARTTIAPKPLVVTSSVVPQTVVIESPTIALGSDSVVRTVASANSVSSTVVVGSPTVVGSSIAVLGDGLASVVNSRVDDHKADSVTVLPVSEVVAGTASISGTSPSVVEFSALASSPVGEHEVNLIVGDAGSSDRGGDNLSFEANSVRQSKRKRKPPSALEEAAGGSAGGSWVRAASNILWKVCRYRGTNREKGELNAAAWFTQPVDQADAPDYYSIIKNPMDFATIRKKLENGQYSQFDDFHADMLLVRSNCFVYNPPDTRVCRDCTQVFSFYDQEINRLLDKSANKVHTGSPAKKIIRIDKSPGKS